jgi:hypothetical protein
MEIPVLETMAAVRIFFCEFLYLIHWGLAHCTASWGATGGEKLLRDAGKEEFQIAFTLVRFLPETSAKFKLELPMIAAREAAAAEKQYHGHLLARYSAGVKKPQFS